MTIDIDELRNDAKTAHFGHTPLEVPGSEMLELLGRLEAAERERDNAKKLADVLAVALNTSNHERANLRAKIEQMTKRLRTILEEPKENMSNSKALREMVRQARLALEESK